MATYTEYKIRQINRDGTVYSCIYKTTVGTPAPDETGRMVTPVSRVLLGEREYHLPRYTKNDILDFLDEESLSFVTPGWPVLPSQATRQPRELSAIRKKDKSGRNTDTDD
jgi:hypothetical protein